MLEFTINYWQAICFVLGIIFIAVILIRRGQVGKLKEMILYLCSQAEIDLGAGTGTLKRSQVMAYIYNALPTIAKILLPVNTISKIIEDGKCEMDTYLAENEKAKALIIPETDEGFP